MYYTYTHAGRSSTVIPMAEAILYNVATLGTVNPRSTLEIYPLSAPMRLASSDCVRRAFFRASRSIWALCVCMIYQLSVKMVDIFFIEQRMV